MSLIACEALGVRLDNRPVLTGVSLEISKGEIVTIVGPNGSGKSTLLRTLIGAVEPTEGRVSRAKTLRIGYVPQKLDIDPTLPIDVMRFLSLPHAVPRARRLDALARVGAEGTGNRQMADLSGGQFQRALLARALLTDPNLLILDEPTQGMDQPGSANFYQLLAEIRNQTGCSVLMVSHELTVVMGASDRVICLNGHVCCEGTPEVVASAPEYHALFGTAPRGALALYRHEHDHTHDTGHAQAECIHDTA